MNIHAMNIHAMQDIPMQKFRLSLALLAVLVAACSPKPAPQSDAAPITTPASVAIPAPASTNAAAAPEDKKCTNEPRRDENDKRPRCGGMDAALPAPRAYRIVVGGGDPVDQVVCDIGKTFVLEGKLFGTEFSGGMEGTYRMVRTPNVPGMQWKGSGTYRIDLPDGPDAPGTLNVHAREATTRAGGLVDENAGYTDAFTMTPVADCKAAPQGASG